MYPYSHSLTCAFGAPFSLAYWPWSAISSVPRSAPEQNRRLALNTVRSSDDADRRSTVWFTYFVFHRHLNYYSKLFSAELYERSKNSSDHSSVFQIEMRQKRTETDCYRLATGSSSPSIVMGSAGQVCIMSVHRSPFRTIATGEQLPMTRSRLSRATVPAPVCIRSSPSSEISTSLRGVRSAERPYGG